MGCGGKRPCCHPLIYLHTPLHPNAIIANSKPEPITKWTKIVDPKLAAKVRKAAADIGVDLRKSPKANTVFIVLSNRDLSHPVHSAIMRGAQACVESRGLDTVVVPVSYPLTTAAKDLRLPQILEDRNLVHAAILIGATSHQFIEALNDRGIPFAVFGNNVIGDWSRSETDFVAFDGVQGGYESTTYLIELGHHDIWHVTDCRYPWFADTAEGYRRAMAAAGLPPRIQEIRAQEPEIGYLGAKSILTQQEAATAIFAASDDVARGVYKALDERNVKIPEQMSVMGFNDTVGQSLHPPLTSSRFFLEEMGAHLVEFALGRSTAPLRAAQQFVIPMLLVKRESCAPPPGLG
jgi:LacI family transcriptional regulator